MALNAESEVESPNTGDNKVATFELTQHQAELIYLACHAAAQGRGIITTKSAEGDYAQIKQELGRVLHDVDPDRWVKS